MVLLGQWHIYAHINVYSILTNRVRALKSTLGQLTTPAQLFILQAMKHDKLVSAVQHYQLDFHLNHNIYPRSGYAIAQYTVTAIVVVGEEEEGESFVAVLVGGFWFGVGAPVSSCPDGNETEGRTVWCLGSTPSRTSLQLCQPLDWGSVEGGREGKKEKKRRKGKEEKEEREGGREV